MTYTAIWATIITTIFVIILQIVIHNGNQFIKPLLALNLLFVPLATLFGGLRPILGLRIVPDTLYIDRNKLTFKNGEEIDIENIESVNVHQIGAAQSHLLYYEMTLRENPKFLMNRKRKSLVMVEPYDIRHFFQTRLDFLGHLTELGLTEKKIEWNEMKTKHILGFREKFKK